MCLAQVGNIELGIPVRMLRKNDDPGSDFGGHGHPTLQHQQPILAVISVCKACKQ